MRCGKKFDGDKNKFCSVDCEKSHLADLKRRLHDAVDKDDLHSKKLSDD